MKNNNLIVFRERTKFLENFLVMGSLSENETLNEYYKYHTKNLYKEDIELILLT